MAITVQGFSSFQADSQTYIAAQTLKRINRDLIVYPMGKKETLPNRFSKTFQFTRYEKLNLPYSALTEGSTPDNSTMSVSTVQAVMDQWGSYINLSDVAVITAKHPALQQGIELLAEQASETIDRECIKLLQSNTAVTFPGAATSRFTLVATDYITTSVVKEVLSGMRSQGARPVSGRLFMGLMDPFVEMDLLEDATFQNAASYSNIVALFNGEVGTWMGTRWMCSNLIPTMSRLAAVVTASSATAGALTVATTYYLQVTAVDNPLGFEVASTAEQTQATGAGDTSINITMPATTGFTYNVYFGAAAGVTFLFSSQNAPGSVVNVGSVPVSGATPPAFPAVGVVVHFSWVLGQEAFAVPELMSLQTFLTPDQASDSDPLKQRRKAGWKVMFKPVICNELFLERIESASRY
jgi:N4-gp56 family major capsid protein